MVELGYALSSEEFPPEKLVSNAQAADSPAPNAYPGDLNGKSS